MGTGMSHSLYANKENDTMSTEDLIEQSIAMDEFRARVTA